MVLGWVRASTHQRLLNRNVFLIFATTRFWWQVFFFLSFSCLKKKVFKKTHTSNVSHLFSAQISFPWHNIFMFSCRELWNSGFASSVLRKWIKFLADIRSLSWNSISRGNSVYSLSFDWTFKSFRALCHCVSVRWSNPINLKFSALTDTHQHFITIAVSVKTFKLTTSMQLSPKLWSQTFCT